MLDLRLFIVVVTLGFAGIILAQTVSLRDPFEAADDVALARVDRLAGDDIAAVKFAHACARSPYVVGLFGNSRSVMVGARALGLDEREFFNFSVPGASVLQSIALLERLVDRGCAPRLALVSVDHPVTEFFGNALFPGPPRRWLGALSDVVDGLRSADVSSLEVARMVRRHVFVEWQQFRALLSAQQLAARWGVGAKAGTDAARYRRDGSRRGEESRVPVALAPPPVERFSVLPGYLSRAVARVARIDRVGTRVVLYESPIAPSVAVPASERTASLHRVFLDACRDRGVVCLAAPRLARAAGPPYWTDATHPPERRLAAWLADVVMQARAPAR